MEKSRIPLSIPAAAANEYRKNFAALTNGRERLFLIAGDQKLEHLNDDFFGKGIALEDAEPEHLFRIARASRGGALAVPLGLISRYGSEYRDLCYIAKINGKTNLGANETKDSHRCLWTVADVLKLKRQSGLRIAAIGYTVYLGGQYEAQMLAEASRAIWEAHQAGLLAVIWMYPRGKDVKEEDIHTIAGGAGVAAALGADFVKLKYPSGAKEPAKTAERYQEAVKAAGRTSIVCVGGSRRPVRAILEELDRQIRISGTAGIAIGRNLHQRNLAEAARLAEAIGSILWHGASAAAAERIYLGRKKAPAKVASRFLGLF